MKPFRWGPEHDPANWLDCRECGAPGELHGERVHCLLGHVTSIRDDDEATSQEDSDTDQS